MKQRKVPYRMCVVTHEKYEKKDLIRVVKTKDGEVLVDHLGKANGKGAYLKHDKDVILKAKKTNALGRCLAIDVPDAIYDELLKDL